jgi:hypothetical protein
MTERIRVMLEAGRKRSVASAFDWPGWVRSARSEGDALAVLAAYRPRYAKVADLAGLGEEFGATGELEVVERLEGTGMGDFYGVSGRTAAPEYEQMSGAECERKVELLRACWAFFDGVAARVSPQLRTGLRGGGRDRDRIVRHTYGAEIQEYAKKMSVTVGPEILNDLDARRAYRDTFCDAIREHNARGAAARSWTVQFLIRRCAYHLLDHAWEMEDRDLTGAA